MSAKHWWNIVAIYQTLLIVIPAALQRVRTETVNISTAREHTKTPLRTTVHNVRQNAGKRGRK